MPTSHETNGSRPWRLAVLISGSGRTLRNLLDVIERGDLDAKIVCVASSRSGVMGLDIASDAGIPAYTITGKANPGPDRYARAMYEVLEPHAPDMVVMAGFLRHLPVYPGWEGRILNIHPALLPEAGAYAAGKGMYGDRVHQAVIDHGDTVSGATVHVVTQVYDEGPPLLRAEVPVLPDDTMQTLAARVFAEECVLYPEAIRRYLAAHPELKRG
ncbi:MAG TPA: phosphoribosylglycinamide formyltransferase [Thermomicrobiales bacterium]|nr:phosphoribosylglycinamide formyltransferase [Thermomicrobiales bacterium]